MKIGLVLSAWKNFMNYDKRIPIAVKKNTIIEAICEFQLTPNVEKFSHVVLGVVYTSLDGNKAIIQSTPSGFPNVVINSEPIFNFAQTSSISWNDYKISFSDNSVVIGSKQPYPRWAEFKPVILKVLDLVLNSGLVKSVDRYSLKYVDFVTSETAHPSDLIDLSLILGGRNYSQAGMQLNLEIKEGEIVHLLGVTNPALERQANTIERVGAILSTDSIVVCTNEMRAEYFEGNKGNFEARLDELHVSNKNFFFGILSEEGIRMMEPDYA